MFIFAILVKCLQQAHPENFATCEISQPTLFQVANLVFGALCTILSFMIYIIILYIYIYLKIIIIICSLKNKKNKNFAVQIFSTCSNCAAQYCFRHNFSIRTPFLEFLVPLERLESVKSKYSHK